MGKEEQSVPTTVVVVTHSSEQNAVNRCRFKGLVRFRCILALLLGVGVLLSVVFWLPPFFGRGNHGDLDLDSRFGGGCSLVFEFWAYHDIVASFMVEKPISFLEDNILRLGDDIFDEIGVLTTKVNPLSVSLSLPLCLSLSLSHTRAHVILFLIVVSFSSDQTICLQQVVILSLESSAGSNITTVVFGIEPDDKNSIVSSAAKSLIRANFASLVIHQSSLRLTASLFGDPMSFEVLKFRGGITVSPPQKAFLLQKVQIRFNFTLNYSIDEIQESFSELTSQLKSGLSLASYENLYISLANSKGSTLAPPTTVQSLVVLAVGTPSMARLKQLAETITDSHSKNLGLNNTEFGKVKQVQLSSTLPHSVHGVDGTSPSPAPLPHPHHHHHSHHHHHHHHHHNVHQAPAISPAPVTERRGTKAEDGSPASAPVVAPAPQKSHDAKPPGCHLGYRKRFPRKEHQHSPLVSPVAPPVSPQYTAASPRQQARPLAPLPHLVPAFSPLPNVVFAHSQPPSKSEFDAEPPDLTPSVLPLQSSCIQFECLLLYSNQVPDILLLAASGGFGRTDLWALPLLVMLLDLVPASGLYCGVFTEISCGAWNDPIQSGKLSVFSRAERYVGVESEVLMFGVRLVG
ncbi:hypothetical protein RJ640_012647 [Escallonia rubra]|uniref:DUF7036 domain-containing protein n=1 Tax=Escallonia rubra TaxID=112253 RepID=A0AA88QVV2_9ASTE|nr:hypothetical protein RJ640_012647 [Escallonia rubra]